MNAERTGGLFWLLFGCAAIYGGLDLELGTMQEPGSGFLTFVAGSFVACMALLIIIQSYRADPDVAVRVADLWKGVKWKRAVAITVLIALFIVSFETLGFFVCSLALLIIIIQSYRTDPAVAVRVADLWKGLKWKRAVAITILIALFIVSFETLGFFVCSLALLIVIMRWLEGLNWKLCLLVPSIAIGTTYIVFKFFMNISLPAGIFGF